MNDEIEVITDKIIHVKDKLRKMNDEKCSAARHRKVITNLHETVLMQKKVISQLRKELCTTKNSLCHAETKLLECLDKLSNSERTMAIHVEFQLDQMKHTIALKNKEIEILRDNLRCANKKLPEMKFEQFKHQFCAIKAAIDKYRDKNELFKEIERILHKITITKDTNKFCDKSKIKDNFCFSSDNESLAYTEQQTQLNNPDNNDDDNILQKISTSSPVKKVPKSEIKMVVFPSNRVQRKKLCSQRTKIEKNTIKLEEEPENNCKKKTRLNNISQTETRQNIKLARSNNLKNVLIPSNRKQEVSVQDTSTRVLRQNKILTNMTRRRKILNCVSGDNCDGNKPNGVSIILRKKYSKIKTRLNNISQIKNRRKTKQSQNDYLEDALIPINDNQEVSVRTTDTKILRQKKNSTNITRRRKFPNWVSSDDCDDDKPNGVPIIPRKKYNLRNNKIFDLYKVEPEKENITEEFVIIPNNNDTTKLVEMIPENNEDTKLQVAQENITEQPFQIFPENSNALDERMNEIDQRTNEIYTNVNNENEIEEVEVIEINYIPEFKEFDDCEATECDILKDKLYDSYLSEEMVEIQAENSEEDFKQVGDLDATKDKLHNECKQAIHLEEDLKKGVSNLIKDKPQDSCSCKKELLLEEMDKIEPKNLLEKNLKKDELKEDTICNLVRENRHAFDDTFEIIKRELFGNNCFNPVTYFHDDAELLINKKNPHKQNNYTPNVSENNLEIELLIDDTKRFESKNCIPDMSENNLKTELLKVQKKEFENNKSVLNISANDPEMELKDRVKAVENNFTPYVAKNSSAIKLLGDVRIEYDCIPDISESYQKPNLSTDRRKLLKSNFISDASENNPKKTLLKNREKTFKILNFTTDKSGNNSKTIKKNQNKPLKIPNSTTNKTENNSKTLLKNRKKPFNMRNFDTNKRENNSKKELSKNREKRVEADNFLPNLSKNNKKVELLKGQEKQFGLDHFIPNISGNNPYIELLTDKNNQFKKDNFSPNISENSPLVNGKKNITVSENILSTSNVSVLKGNDNLEQTFKEIIALLSENASLITAISSSNSLK